MHRNRRELTSLFLAHSAPLPWVRRLIAAAMQLSGANFGVSYVRCPALMKPPGIRRSGVMDNGLRDD